LSPYPTGPMKQPMATKPYILPRWLKLKDAATYSAIGVNRLVALAEEGTVRGFKDPDSGRGDWIFDRDSLDAYRESQAVDGESGRVNERVMEILAERKCRFSFRGRTETGKP